jgi:hypothetical protein
MVACVRQMLPRRVVTGGRALHVDILKAGGVSQLLHFTVGKCGRRVADPDTRVLPSRSRFADRLAIPAESSTDVHQCGMMAISFFAEAVGLHPIAHRPGVWNPAH